MTAHPVNGAAWIASAHPDPKSVEAQWQTHCLGTATVPAGVVFDVVRMPLPLGYAVVQTTFSVEPPALLADRLSRRAYLFVPPGTAETWDLFPTAALGRGYWIAVPKPGAVAWIDDAVIWETAPDAGGRMMDPDQLRTAVRRNTGHRGTVTRASHAEDTPR
ncbi:hypothetical protein [Streptomyces celluloflavus]|uniref:hypothetical protein n=1 Tax=Streptomyces celluloflavus TaxID=58344 RepID=UPI0036BCD50E